MSRKVLDNFWVKRIMWNFSHTHYSHADLNFIIRIFCPSKKCPLNKVWCMALRFFSLVIENLNSLALAGIVIRSWRPQVPSWRGTVFVRDCTHLPHSLFWILRTAAEGKIGSADWYLQKVSTKFWFLSIGTMELECDHDIF